MTDAFAFPNDPARRTTTEREQKLVVVAESRRHLGVMVVGWEQHLLLSYNVTPSMFQGPIRSTPTHPRQVLYTELVTLHPCHAQNPCRKHLTGTKFSLIYDSKRELKWQ